MSRRTGLTETWVARALLEGGNEREQCGGGDAEMEGGDTRQQSRSSGGWPPPWFPCESLSPPTPLLHYTHGRLCVLAPFTRPTVVYCPASPPLAS